MHRCPRVSPALTRSRPPWQQRSPRAGAGWTLLGICSTLSSGVPPWPACRSGNTSPVCLCRQDLGGAQLRGWGRTCLCIIRLSICMQSRVVCHFSSMNARKYSLQAAPPARRFAA